ncbi:MAG: ATP phosphoribosyltransferase regulatory subunit, partial [Chloroflexi bacterium]|nr:ATP phosphoribosyltransferase regulatory subunit [Chloroflexota bacterium]
ERFLEAERSGKRQLDALQHAVHSFDSGQGILSLIVEMMAFDTQKHIAMLDYLRKHLQD